MTCKLNQIIAVVNGKKTKTQRALTDVYHNLQKPTLFEGIARLYEPLDEDGETFPPENKLVQYKTKDALREATEALTDLLDATATQDWGNCRAVADVKVDSKVLLTKVPVTYLLFLEKQLTDVHTFVSKLPILPTEEKWDYSQEVDAYVSDKHMTNKTKKVMRNHVKAESTKEHPAQVETYTEDVKVGEWSTVKFSGAIPAKKRNEMLERVQKLQESVKHAREEANLLDVEPVKIGGSLFNYLFS